MQFFSIIYTFDNRYINWFIQNEYDNFKIYNTCIYRNED